MALSRVPIDFEDPRIQFSVKTEVLEIEPARGGGWEPDEKPPGMRPDGSSYWRPLTGVYASREQQSRLDAKVGGHHYFRPDFRELECLFGAMWGMSSAKAMAESVGGGGKSATTGGRSCSVATNWL